jgi:hypothetical protein
MGSPTYDDLCQSAYRFWEERGCPQGSPEVDWQLAEHELGIAEHEGDAPPNEPAGRAPGGH